VRRLELTLEAWELAVCRLEAAAAVPEWAMTGAFHAIVRTPDELSIVCDAAAVPAGVRAEKGWRCFSLEGPIPFEETGVLSALAVPLAEAKIGIFVVSTFDTDYLMVAGRNVDAARRALEAAGHQLIAPPG
jgi:hypothetical protein